MNPNNKDLEALREDYLRQKFPGNLPDMIDQSSPLPSSKQPEQVSTHFGRLAVAALVLIGLGLGFILTSLPRTPVAEQPALENRNGKQNSPNDLSSTSKKTKARSEKRVAALNKTSFFGPQMVLTSYRQNRVEQANQNSRPVKTTSKPDRRLPVRKSNFWKSNRRQLATNLKRPKQSSGTRTKDEKKEGAQPIQQRRWLKPRYEFKSIIDPLYKYRRS